MHTQHSRHERSNRTQIGERMQTAAAAADSARPFLCPPRPCSHRHCPLRLCTSSPPSASYSCDCALPPLVAVVAAMSKRRVTLFDNRDPQEAKVSDSPPAGQAQQAAVAAGSANRGKEKKR